MRSLLQIDSEIVLCICYVKEKLQLFYVFKHKLMNIHKLAQNRMHCGFFVHFSNQSLFKRLTLFNSATRKTPPFTTSCYHFVIWPQSHTKQLLFV